MAYADDSRLWVSGTMDCFHMKILQRRGIFLVTGLENKESHRLEIMKCSLLQTEMKHMFESP